MTPTVRHLAAATRRFCAPRGRALPAAWLVALVLLTLPSCNRAAYVFRANSAAYLATERPAPSVPGPAALAAPADSLPPVASPRPAAPTRRLAKKQRPAKAKALGSSHLLKWVRPLAAKAVTKRLAKLSASPNAASQYGGRAPSSTLIVGLSLIGAGLIGLLIAAGMSANIVGALFGVFFAVLGSLALVVGLILVLIALLANE